MSTTLGSKAVGNSVYFTVNGTKTEFLVVNQGKPSSLYDDSCNGTWLLMKQIYNTQAWDSSNNDYKNSDIHSWLNNSFLSLLPTDTVNLIKTVKIPYRNGTGKSGTTATGSNGLSTKVFLLSGYEVGFTTSDSSYFPVDGARLSYFSSQSARIAYNSSGSAAHWWLRSPYTNYTGSVWYVGADGGSHDSFYSSAYGVRPAFILDSSLSVSDDGYITTNTAPSAPSSISVPSSIMGGSNITVSWSAATDDDGNLAGYIVQKSTDGGSSWSQIYQSTATSTTNLVAKGTSSVMYRVKAYDTEGEESAWRTSSQVTVVNNDPPSACASISVPNEVLGGGTLTITWAAATDTDGNLSGYILQRSTDGGTNWTQVYKGSALTYTDSITKGWTSVMYRVKAYDSYDAESSYTTSTARTVDNNSAPTITSSSSGDLGTKTAGFSVSYSVNDEDADDTVTVTETLDSTTKRTYTATKNATNSFAVTGDYFQKVLNGSHTMTISATDGKATTTKSLTFTKSVTKAVISMTTPMDADAQITICSITVGGSIPADATFTVEVTNNGKDTSPVWEDCTTEARSGRNYLFTNATAANGFAFNFRVTAERGSSGTGGYITSIQGGFQ